MNQLEIGSQITAGVVPSTEVATIVSWKVFVVIGIGILVLLIVQNKYEKAAINRMNATSGNDIPE